MIGFILGVFTMLILQWARTRKVDKPFYVSHTSRGFPYVGFVDVNGKKCSIQKSSSAIADKIWLGVSNPEPMIMSQNAIQLGLRKATFDERDNGWIPYSIPKEVSINTRMHLTQQQVAEMIPILTHFVKTGELCD